MTPGFPVHSDLGGTPLVPTLVEGGASTAA
jgi:hypothetical protein